MDENIFFNQLKPEDIIDSFVLPHGLSVSEKLEADAILIEVLNKKRMSIISIQSVEDNILQK